MRKRTLVLLGLLLGLLVGLSMVLFTVSGEKSSVVSEQVEFTSSDSVVTPESGSSDQPATRSKSEVTSTDEQASESKSPETEVARNDEATGAPDRRDDSISKSEKAESERSVVVERRSKDKSRSKSKPAVPMLLESPERSTEDERRTPRRKRRAKKKVVMKKTDRTTEKKERLERLLPAEAAQKRLPPPEPSDPAEGDGDLLVVELDGFENRPVVSETVVSQPMTETKVDPMSTFSIDVDTGAYTLARARLRQGYRPDPEKIRLEEFLNYFHYDYPEPAEGAFAVHLEAAPDPFSSNDRRQLVRIGVKGKGVPEEKRPPAHLTFLIDVSGSMFGADKLDLVKESLELVTRNLRPDDTLAIVTFATEAAVRLWPAGASERDLISRTIESLEPGGSSGMDEGLRLAYEVASTHFRADHINRVVVLGDGRANVGETRPERLLRSIRSAVEDGVELSTVGFGAKAFNDEMMERLANSGNGNYFFVDSYREAQRVFGYRLCGTLYTIAKDVKIQVEFNPDSVLRHRLLGYENRRLEHRQFRDDAVDAGEIGAGHSVTAIYEVETVEAPAETLATVRIRHKLPGSDVATESDYHLWAEELRSDVREASDDFKFAAAVALFAEVLSGDEPGDRDRMSLIREIASEAIRGGDQQAERLEFLALVDEATPYFVN